MRGPKLVGYPPTGLRWSGDSSRLYFEWRQAGDDEPSTWVVARDGGQPRKLTDEERRSAPPVNGRWDKAHRRVLFVDRGDIVLLDTVAGTRRQITRTTGNEANPRWARRESAITFTRDNNLFIVPLDSGEIAQLTDVQPRKRDPRDTDSQKFIKAEEPKLIEHTRVEAEKKKKAEEKDKANALPKFELADRQSATDLQLSPDGKHVFVLVVERADAAKRPNVPNYVTESSYTEDIPARTFVGDAQDQPLAGGHESGDGQDRDGRRSRRPAPRTQRKRRTRRTRRSRRVRWGMPLLSDDGALAIAHVRARPTTRIAGWWPSIRRRARSACSTRCTTTRGCARSAGSAPVDPSYGLLPDQKHVWFLSERDGWMHLYTRRRDRAAAGRAPADAGQVGNRRRRSSPPTGRSSTSRAPKCIRASGTSTRCRSTAARATKLTSMIGGTTGEVSPDDSTFGLIYSSSTKPHEVYVMPNRAGAAGDAGDDLDQRGVAVVQVDRAAADHLQDARRRGRLRAAVHAGDDRREARSGRARGRLRPRRRLPAERAQVLVRATTASTCSTTCSRRAATSCSIPTTARAPATDATGARRSTATWAARISKTSSTARSFSSRSRRSNAKRIGVYGGSYGGFITLMAMFTTPDVFAAGRGAPAGHRLDALQPRLHVEHPQRAAERCRGVPQELADLLRGRAEGRAADLPRHGRHERALPGQRAPGAAADRAAQGELVGRAVPGREPRLRGRRRAGRTSTSAS